ncbi:MAG: RNA methyltransferase [Pseudomonadota bacterium]
MSQPRARRTSANVKPQGEPRPGAASWLYGRHAVAAALRNPDRDIARLLLTKNAAARLSEDGLRDLTFETVSPAELGALLPNGAVHQGAGLLAPPPPASALEDVCAPADASRPVLVIDQVEDPQNLGALFRVAAAFEVRAVILQDRRTPPLAGSLAKAAAGGVDLVPHCRVVNISQAVNALQELGYHVIGLTGDAEADIAKPPQPAPLALALGSESAGLRRLVRERCDTLARIPISNRMESLNVSNAAAIAFFALKQPSASSERN